MNKRYGGLRSNPVNKKQTTISTDRTTTFSGDVIETSPIIPEDVQSDIEDVQSDITE